MSSKPSLTFKTFLSSLQEDYPLVPNYCKFIKDRKLRANCRKLYKKTRNNVSYGGGFGNAPVSGPAGGSSNGSMMMSGGGSGSGGD